MMRQWQQKLNPRKENYWSPGWKSKWMDYEKIAFTCTVASERRQGNLERNEQGSPVPKFSKHHAHSPCWSPKSLNTKWPSTQGCQPPEVFKYWEMVDDVILHWPWCHFAKKRAKKMLLSRIVTFDLIGLLATNHVIAYISMAYRR